MKAGPYLCVGVLALSHPVVVSAQPSGAPTLRSVQAAVEGPVTIVTVTADGPLPEPVSGTADAPPPRIFFDFTGVNPLPGDAGRVIRLPGSGAVAGVRVALFSIRPNVTRVALDLAQLEPFSVDLGDRQSGRIRIVVGSRAATTPASPAPAPSRVAPPVATAPAAPPAPAPVPPPVAAPMPPPPLARPQTPSVPSPPVAAAKEPVPEAPVPGPAGPPRRGVRQVEPGPVPPPAAVESYRRQVSDSVERLESRRAVIAAIDLERTVAAGVLEAALADLKLARASLEAARASDELRPTHELLLAASALAANAVTLRLDADRANDESDRRNAASTAAGALMLLDRACAVLTCAPPR